MLFVTTTSQARHHLVNAVLNMLAEVIHAAYGLVT
jgi:hypothetical protein